MLAVQEGSARHRWSTADVEPRRALTYWTEQVFEARLEIDSPARPCFSGQLEFAQFGPAGLFIIEADAQIVRRTHALTVRKQVPGYLLVHMRSGQLQFAQYGRKACVAAGDCALVDLAAPFEMEMTRTRSISMFFKHEWLRNWIPAPQNIAARVLDSRSGWGAALAAALASLETAHEEPLALPEGTVAEQIAALLALAAGPTGQPMTATRKLFNRIQRTIRDRCHEPGLDPATVAAEHGISRRYLHHLFACSSTTFGSELMRMRLELAHRMLSDARFDALSVSEISARCGFVEPSHFARRFRKAYGMVPTAFRAARRRTAPRMSAVA
ncbi:MAG: helix-turn-helix domain-containing protein [Steroidobacteraceae bacterium]|nr:helix-turn-helix domain-containing protein [Steroidobacteraceae bacterium]